MKPAHLVASLFVGCGAALTLAAGCVPDWPGVTPSGDSAGGNDEQVQDQDLPWWLDDNPGGDPFVPPDDNAGGDSGGGGDTSVATTLLEKVAGAWAGEITLAGGGLRLLGVEFEPTGDMTYTINPFGPSRLETPGTAADVDDTTLVIDLDGVEADLTWHDVEVAGDRLTFYDQELGEITLARGLTPPLQGLLAELMVYDAADADALEVTDWGKFLFDGVLSFVRDWTPEPICYDFVFGVTSLRFSGDDTFAVRAIPGFDRYGGTNCTSTDRFVVIYSGGLSLPAGATYLRFNTDASDDVDDAGVVFVSDGVASAANADDAVLCSTELGWRNPDCYKVNGDYIGGEEIVLDGGPSGGEFPFEAIFLEAEGDVFFNLEIDPGHAGTYGPFPPELLSPLIPQ